MSITTEQVQQVLRNAKSSDQVLAKMLEAANAKGVSLNDAAKIAQYIGTIAQSKGVDNNTIANSLVDAFKAALYQGLLQRNEKFPDANLHNSLTTNFNNAVAMIKQVQSQQSGSLLGNSGGGSILGNNTGNGGVSLALSGGGVGIPLTIDPTPAPNPNTGASLNIPTGGGVVLESAPAAAAPAVAPQPAVEQPAIVSPMATANATQLAVLTGPSDRDFNESIFNLMDDKMETYAEHELQVKTEAVSKTAKQANADVKLFTEGGDWRTELKAITEQDSAAVYFQDADILVRIDEDVRTYYVGHTEADKDLIRSFYETHRDQMSTLRKAQEIKDVEKLIEMVHGVITKLRENAIGLHNKINEGKFSTVTAASEARRFINSYLYMIDIHVHNALSIQTEGGTKLPTGRVINFERKAEDLDYFTTNVYQTTVGENGESTEEDWFRELLEMVAVSLGKHAVRCEDGGTVLILSHTIATVVIPGTYSAVEKEHVIGAHTLSATADAITEIFEELYAHRPTMNVVLETPNSKHLLLSSGGVGAAIRY